ncbi:MAG TPA: ATP-dependent Clp protease adapter ClpS [Chloroflexota bacterium]|jgi:ATP-dependent Clp protease adaptor protein ClpS
MSKRCLLPRLLAAPAAPTTTPETPTATPETPTLPNVEDLAKLLPPYKVLLHNDDHNSMDHVVRSLLRSVPKLSRIRAIQIMLEAHNHGVALVIVCPLEQAELFRDRLESCGLTATIEAA